ncbi:MAG: NADH-quinone oxidoreductase subunit A, partial [Myxococcota bacterium]
LIFIVFDVAIAAALPSFVTFKYFILQNDYQNILISLFAFLTILMVALFYVWIKGDLDWIKK